MLWLSLPMLVSMNRYRDINSSMLDKANNGGCSS